MVVGFVGGSLMYNLGDREAMLRFSRSVEVIASSDSEWEGMHDKIYRTFVPLADVPKAIMLMRNARKVLDEAGDRDQIEAMSRHEDGAVFVRYFEAFEECATSSEAFFKEWGELIPVRVARVDMPAYLLDTARSLNEIAALAGGEEPYWVVASE